MDFTDVEKRLEQLSAMRHEELMPLLEDSQKKLATIAQNRDLSETGRRKQVDAARAEISLALDEIGARFEKEATDLPLRMQAIIEHHEKSASENETDKEIRVEYDGFLMDSDLEILRGQERAKRRLDKLINLLDETRRESLLLKELEAMDAGELVIFAENARNVDDSIAFDLLRRFGKRRIAAGGDVQAAARFSGLMRDWEAARVPPHRRRAGEIQDALSKSVAEWRLFMREVQSQLTSR